MATLSYKNGRGVIQFTMSPRMPRKTIRLGKLQIESARAIRLHVEALIASKTYGQTLPAETMSWVGRIGAKLHDRISRAGLVSPRLDASSPRVLTYFVQKESGGPIKIGRAREIASRMNVMQSGSIETLVCIAFIPCDIERELHEQFSDLRICGEWFRDDARLLGFIRESATACRISCPLPSAEAIRRKSLLRQKSRRASAIVCCK